MSSGTLNPEVDPDHCEFRGRSAPSHRTVPLATLGSVGYARRLPEWCQRTSDVAIYEDDRLVKIEVEHNPEQTLVSVETLDGRAVIAVAQVQGSKWQYKKSS